MPYLSTEKRQLNTVILQNITNLKRKRLKPEGPPLQFKVVMLVNTGRGGVEASFRARHANETGPGAENDRLAAAKALTPNGVTC